MTLVAFARIILRLLSPCRPIVGHRRVDLGADEPVELVEAQGDGRGGRGDLRDGRARRDERREDRGRGALLSRRAELEIHERQANCAAGEAASRRGDDEVGRQGVVRSRPDRAKVGRAQGGVEPDPNCWRGDVTLATLLPTS